MMMEYLVWLRMKRRKRWLGAFFFICCLWLWWFDPTHRHTPTWLLPFRRTNSSSSSSSEFLLLLGSDTTTTTTTNNNNNNNKDCDFLDGKWVWDSKGSSLYNDRDCEFLDIGFRCLHNGRPDRLYTNWRWQPHHCHLPRFDAKDMLQRLRNRRVVFVGDSIGRNQWESLLCMLSSAVLNKSSIYERNGSPITKHNGFLIFNFADYNCTVEYYRAPFLVLQSRPPPGVHQNVSTTLKLDVMDWTSSRWKGADLLVFNTGHWWNYEKTIRSGCYFQEGGNVKMDMSVESAYSRSIETLVDWIQREVNTTKTHVIYRTYSPVHFSGGDWRSGGSCHLERLPEFVGSPQERLPKKPWMSTVNTIRNVLSQRSGSRRISINMEVLNITWMTDQRKDGHSSIYYVDHNQNPPVAPVRRQDCSHWCLPGIPDTWNELLYAFFIRRDNKSATNASTNTVVQQMH